MALVLRSFITGEGSKGHPQVDASRSLTRSLPLSLPVRSAYQVASVALAS